MSAEVESLVWTGKTPWHGLGVEVQDVMTSQEAIKYAGLDWEVQKEPITLAKNGKVIPRGYAIVREKDDQILGLAGEVYKPLQNQEAFTFMDRLVHDGSMQYHVAGSLKEGRQIFLLGKIGTKEIVPSDHLDEYLLLVNNHDGTGRVRILFTGVRVVCANTVTLALSKGVGQGVAIKHTQKVLEHVYDAQKILGLARENFNTYHDFLQTIKSISINQDKLDNYLNTLFPSPNNPEIAKVTETRRQNKRDIITHLFENGTGQDIKGVKGTGLAAYNAVTEYLSHFKPVRGKTNIEDKRFSQFTTGNLPLLDQATQFLVNLA